MRTSVKGFAEMYAMQAISLSQLVRECHCWEILPAIKYANAYGKEYDHYLYGLQEAAKYGLEDEYNYCYFRLHMSVEEALAEWDLEL